MRLCLYSGVPGDASEVRPQIDDISEVKCSYVEGDENSLLPVSGVDVKTMQFQFVFFFRLSNCHEVLCADRPPNTPYKL
jgi:hypothetical protein